MSSKSVFKKSSLIYYVTLYIKLFIRIIQKSIDLIEKSYDEKITALKLNFFMKKEKKRKKGLAESFFPAQPIKMSKNRLFFFK